MEHIALCTPTHKTELSQLEEKRIEITLKFNHKSPHYFVLPNDIETYYFQRNFPKSKIIKFDSKHFNDFESYNKFMLNQNFYNAFLNFNYILVVQADAFLVKEISQLLTFDYDYVGAQWVPPFTIQNIGSRLFINKKIPVCRQTILRIGNGGLSLRKVKSMIEVVRWWNKSSNKKKLYRKGSLKLNEDLAVAYAAKKMGLNIPDKPSNASFFVEKDYRKFEPGEVYGFHGLGKINPEFELEILDLAEKQLEITNDWIDKS